MFEKEAAKIAIIFLKETMVKVKLRNNIVETIQKFRRVQSKFKIHCKISRAQRNLIRFVVKQESDRMILNL